MNADPTHEHWMQVAIDEAMAAAQAGDAPIAAVLVRHGSLLAVGRNTKTSSRCGFAHAELNALLKAAPLLGRHPHDATLYVTLEPCAMCLGAIIFAGIGTLVYGAHDKLGGAVRMFASDATYRQWMPRTTGGILLGACEQLRKMAMPTAGHD